MFISAATKAATLQSADSRILLESAEPCPFSTHAKKLLKNSDILIIFCDLPQELQDDFDHLLAFVSGLIFLNCLFLFPNTRLTHSESCEMNVGFQVVGAPMRDHAESCADLLIHLRWSI